MKRTKKIMIGLVLAGALALPFITGCGTTFEQRVGYYKAGVNWAIGTVTNGTATNLVSTLKSLY